MEMNRFVSTADRIGEGSPLLKCALLVCTGLQQKTTPVTSDVDLILSLLFNTHSVNLMVGFLQQKTDTCVSAILWIACS